MRNLLVSFVAIFFATLLHAQTPVQVRLSDGNDSRPATPSTEKVTLSFLAAVKENSVGNRAQAAEIFNAISMLTEDRHTASLYYLAKLAMEEHDFAKAEHYAKRALATDGDNTLYLKLLCDSYLDRRLFSEADSIVNHLLTVDSTDQMIKRLSIFTIYQLGDHAKALELAENYDRQYGYDRLVLDCRLEILVSQRKFEELLKVLDRALAVSDDPDLLAYNGQVLATMGRDSAALASYDAALKQSTQKAHIYRTISEFWRVKGDTTRYIEAILPILRDSSVQPEAKIASLTNLFNMNVKPESASVQALVDTLTTYDTTLTVKAFEVDYVLFRRDLKRGIELLENIYSLQSPPTNKTLETMARIYFELKSDPARLYNTLLEGAMRYPENLIYATLGVFAFDTPAERKTAIRLCDLAIKSAPRDSIRSQAYTLRADFYNKHKQLSKATADYQKAIEFDPRNATAYNNYAYALAVVGKQLDAALSLADRAVDMEADNYTFLDTKAWVLYRMKRFAEAKTFIIRSVNLIKTPPVDVLLHAGDIYNALNDSTTALYYWNWAAKEGATSEQMGDRLSSKNEGK